MAKVLRNKKLKLYTVEFYEDVGIVSSLLHKDGGQGAFTDIDEESLPYIQFFQNRKDAEKVCKEWNDDEDFDEQAEVREYVINVK